MSTSTPDPKRLRILLLHGYTQSGPLFHAKTRALEKSLRKAFPPPLYALSLEYPTGPCEIKPADLPGGVAPDGNETAYGWWRRKERNGEETPLGRREGEGYVYEGADRAFARVAEYLVSEDGVGGRGFDGVIGFSQGACFAGMLASVLSPGRKEIMDKAKEVEGGIGFPEAFVAKREGAAAAGVIHPPLKFGVSYSGFAPPPNPLYDAIYTPKITTPMLHFIGSVDTVVEEARSLRLVDACDVDKESDAGKSRIVYHPGGHFLPSGKMTVAALVVFIQEAMGWKGEDLGPRGKEELDLPF